MAIGLCELQKPQGFLQEFATGQNLWEKHMRATGEK